jgi:hypothetical protein
MTPRGGLVLVLLVCLAGCQRGCAKPWLADRGIGGDPRTSPSAIVPLNATDCPDGLARCVQGSVEVSLLGTVPHPCTGEACACPWERVGDCDTACTVDGLEVVLAREHAEEQLCASTATGLARPAEATSVVTPCDIRGYRCDGDVLERCDEDGATPRTIAVCSHRCAAESIDADAVTNEQAAALLCAHR